MEHPLLEPYLLQLRSQGYDYYNKEDVLIGHEKFINYLEEKGYSGIISEFDLDMEFWEILNDIKKIIIENGLIMEGSCKSFIDRFEELDNKLLEITIPVNHPPDLPWWYYRVLKKGSAVYAEDVKKTYGIDIEIVV